MKRCLWLAATLLVFSLSAAEWPQWRGPQRNGISEESISTEWSNSGPKTLWKSSVGTGFSAISIGQGRAYTMGNTQEQDTVWCLDALTGKERWRHSYPAQLGPQYYQGGPAATPTVSGNQVFTISKWGDVF